MTGTDTTFFTLCDEGYFIGAVCLINSLRLTGNRGEIVVLDTGLSPAQRSRLEPHVRLFEAPNEVRGTPMLLKPFPHLLDPRGTVVIIDSDMIVTRSLDPIVEQAGAGKVCLFDDIDDRWFPEWEQVFGLARPPRRQHYLTAGFMAFATDRHPHLLRRYWELCKEIPYERTRGAGAAYDQPFWAGDQDALNALLMSEVEADDVVELPEAEGPSPAWMGSPDWLGEVSVEDEHTLRCSLHGHSPYLLHYWGGPKPWQRQSWMRVQRDAFVRLMLRVLFADDVPVRVSPSELPALIRPGAASRAALTALAAINGGARRVLDRLPPDARGRLARAVRRVAR
jgi:hypothetical protein